MKATLTIIRNGTVRRPKAMLATDHHLTQNETHELARQFEEWWKKDGGVIVMSQTTDVAVLDINTKTGEVKVIK